MDLYNVRFDEFIMLRRTNQNFERLKSHNLVRRKPKYIQQHGALTKKQITSFKTYHAVSTTEVPFPDPPVSIPGCPFRSSISPMATLLPLASASLS